VPIAQERMQEQLPKPRVLVIDEERRTLRLAQAFLMNEYEVTACDNPDDGLAIIEQEPFHVLVASHHLQRIDVFQLAARARELQPHLPCLVISNYASPHDPEMQKPGLACITSPYHPATMLDIMERLVIQGETAAEKLYHKNGSPDGEG
jgi:DNA-binding NtrC family response regulator